MRRTKMMVLFCVMTFGLTPGLQARTANNPVCELRAYLSTYSSGFKTLVIARREVKPDILRKVQSLTQLLKKSFKPTDHLQKADVRNACDNIRKKLKEYKAMWPRMVDAWDAHARRKNPEDSRAYERFNNFQREMGAILDTIDAEMSILFP